MFPSGQLSWARARRYKCPLRKDRPMDRRTATTLRIVPIMLAMTALLTLAAGAAQGSAFRSGDDIHISSLHHIQDDFYALGEEILIDGIIDGDFCAAGYRSDIKGEIRGSANLCCRYVHQSGRIIGSLRIFGERTTLNGYVGRSLLLMGREVRLGQTSVIERDANIFGTEIDIDGVIKGDVVCNGSQVHMTGLIEGDLTVEAKEFDISPPAVIRGNLTYTSEKEIPFDTLAGVTIVGEITWNEPREHLTKEKPSLLVNITKKISSLLAAFLFGIIVVKLFRPYAEETFDQLHHRFSIALAGGVLGVLALLFCVILLILSLGATLIGGILLGEGPAIAGMLVLVVAIPLIPITSFISVTGGIILYSGKVVTGFLLGYLILRTLRSKPKTLSMTSLFLGLVALTILCWLPYVGFLLFLFATVAGTGAIVLGIKNCRRGNGPSATGTQQGGLSTGNQ